MSFNNSDIRLAEQRRKDMQREAAQQRRGTTRQIRRTLFKTEKQQSPLWTRVWALL